jgi:hypothetical protein
MKSFFEGIQDFFTAILFNPLDHVRSLELQNWWLANAINWVFVLIGFIAAIYWIRQLKIFNDRGEENKDISSHSFL